MRFKFESQNDAIQNLAWLPEGGGQKGLRRSHFHVYNTFIKFVEEKTNDDIKYRQLILTHENTG